MTILSLLVGISGASPLLACAKLSMEKTTEHRQKLRASLPPPSAPLQALSDEARRIAVPHCGNCHGDAEHAGTEEALRVFDLRDPLWFQDLSVDQLRGAVKRIEGKAKPAQTEVFSQFVKAAIDRIEGTDSATTSLMAEEQA